VFFLLAFFFVRSPSSPDQWLRFCCKAHLADLSRPPLPFLAERTCVLRCCLTAFLASAQVFQAFFFSPCAVLIMWSPSGYLPAKAKYSNSCALISALRTERCFSESFRYSIRSLICTSEPLIFLIEFVVLGFQCLLFSFVTGQLFHGLHVLEFRPDPILLQPSHLTTVDF